MEIKYVINKDSDLTNVKLNNQQKQIVQILSDSGKTEFTKLEIETELTGKLITRQNPFLVFKFYQPHFAFVGFLTLDRKLNPPLIRKTVKKEETAV